MAFHAGVLRRLADTHRLEEVAHVSSVSGGTLLAGLVFAANNCKWPTSVDYVERVAPRIRDTLTSGNVLLRALLLALLPANWRHAFSRANVVAEAIRSCWGIDVGLSELPHSPTWSINATNAETGRRFRFKRDRCGDYQIGYADAAGFRLCEALAVSAAFPGLIGPFAMKPSRYVWKNRAWGAPMTAEVPVDMPYRSLHLYDGGIYDNLGLEPLFDIGTQALKDGLQYVICSDAGAPFVSTDLSPIGPFRAKRLFDIVMDQARALRVRALANFLEQTPHAGVYAQIGADPRTRIGKYTSHNAQRAAELLQHAWLGSSDVQKAAAHGTTLWPLTREQFDRLERHGFETLHWNEYLFSGTGSPQ